MKIIFVMLLSLISQELFSQKFNIQTFPQVSLGYTHIQNSASSKYRIYCPEVKLGLGIEKSFKWGTVYTGLIGGITFQGRDKSNATFNFSSGYTFQMILGNVYSKNIYFIEIPIVFGKNIIKKKFRLSIGPSFRFNLAYNNKKNNSPQSYYLQMSPSLFNAGLSVSLMYTQFKKRDIGITYSHGLSKLYNNTLFVNTSETFFARQHTLSIFINFKKVLL